MCEKNNYCLKLLQHGDTVYNVYRVPSLVLGRKYRINCPYCSDGYADLALHSVRDAGLGEHGLTGVIDKVISVSSSCDN